MTDSAQERANARSKWLRRLVKDAFSRGFFGFAGLAVVMAIVAWWVLGEDAFSRAVSSNADSLMTTVPRIFAALLLAGLIWVLLPRETLSRMIGRNSGFKGLLLATVAGIITPGGPASAFPLLALMGSAGADRGIMIAYITSWATLAIQRTVIWDLPLMGPEFTLVRVLVSLPLPIIAGLIARRIPIEIELKEEFVAQAKRQYANDSDDDADDDIDERGPRS